MKWWGRTSPGCGSASSRTPTTDQTVQKIQEIVDGYPGLYRDVLTCLKERIKEVLTGASATIVIRTFGPDMDVLRAQANDIAAVMGKVPGVTTLKIEPQVLVPQITVRLRPEAAEQFGLTAGQVRRAATTLVQGVKVGEVFQQQRAYAVTVWGAEKLRGDVNALGDLLIDLPGGVAREIEQAVRGLTFPQGYHPEFLGEYAARHRKGFNHPWLPMLKKNCPA